MLATTLLNNLTATCIILDDRNKQTIEPDASLAAYQFLLAVRDNRFIAEKRTTVFKCF